MKIKTHLRVAYDKSRRTHRVQASVRPAHAPLATPRGDPLPTVAFAIMLDIPDRMFAQAEQIIATLTVPEPAAEIAAEVKQQQ